jgi:hypothetical protein
MEGNTMGWIDNVMPPNNVIAEDLELRGIDAAKWRALTEKNQKLKRLITQCYAKHNYGHRHFDEQLHKAGVKLRLDSHCKWLLEEYPELASEKE